MSSKTTIFSLGRKSLKRLLGAWDLFAIGYGDIGSSIYYALGVVAFFSLGMTPISIAIAGVVFICTALTYAELSSTFPEAGGSASFSRHAFNDLISFIAGWGLLLDYIVTIAISAFAVPPYLSHFLTYFSITDLDLKMVQMITSIVLIVLLFILNLIGIKKSTKFSLLLAIFTVVTQLLIIAVAGYFLLNIKEVFQGMKLGGALTLDGFIKGTAMAMVAYTGIESIAQLSGETKRPEKEVPKAIIMTIFVLMVLYIGISFVALSAITPEELGGKYLENPILGITSALPVGSQILTPWVGLIAAMILLIAANAGLIGASRLSYSMGEFYQVPRSFYAIHPKFRTPYIALGFFAFLAISVILLSRGKMLFLADLYNFGAMLAFFSSHVALIFMRIKKPDIKRPFRAPLNIPFKGSSIPLTAVFGAISTLAVWFLIIFTKPEGRNAGLGWLAFGVIMYLFYRRRSKIKPFGKLKVEKVFIPSFKEISYKKILVPTRGGADTNTVQIACQIAKDYKAEVVALHIMEVPDAIPLEVEDKQKAKFAEGALKRAEAIAREYHVPMKCLAITTRRLSDAIKSISEEEECDLIIIGTSRDKKMAISEKIESVLKQAKANVWICS